MDLRQLRYFVAIYEHRNLSRAASASNVAQSALSLHMSNLETDLGSALFVRLPRGMAPTAAGERLYTHAKSILRSIEAAEADLRQASGRIAGDVAVGMAHSAVKAIGVPFMLAVVGRYPDVRVSISESVSAAVLMHLMRSDLDITLIYNPPAEGQLLTEPILEETMYCVGRPEIVGETDAPISFEEVLELPIVLLKQGVSSRALMDDVTLLKRLESRAKLQMDSVQAIDGALGAGLGCAIGTRLIMREQLASGTVRARPIVRPELLRTLHVCRLADRPATFVLEAMRGLLLELVSGAVASGSWPARLLCTERS
jgi:LysR family nitrogen assimilation transcriptional regulator